MKGDCYEAAARFVIGNSRCPGIMLAHGEVTGQGPIVGIRYGHAWAEIGDAVIDPNTPEKWWQILMDSVWELREAKGSQPNINLCTL